MTQEVIHEFEQENKENDAEAFRRVKEKVNPPTKVVIRRLPTTMTYDSFLEQVSPLPDHDYMYFVKADLSLGQNAFARAYINFLYQEDIFIFKDKFDGYIFIDQKGNEYPAVVEFAPFQKVPKKKTKKKDSKCGSIEQDADYQKFLESLHSPEEVNLPNAESYLEEIESRQRELKANNGCLKLTTPLIEFIKQKKAEKQRIKDEKREERKRRELEKKRMREEERKRRKAEKEKEKEKIIKDKAKKSEPAVKLLKNPDREKEKFREAEKDSGEIAKGRKSYEGSTNHEKGKITIKDRDWDRDYSRNHDEERLNHKERQKLERDRIRREQEEQRGSGRSGVDDPKLSETSEADSDKLAGFAEEPSYPATKSRNEWKQRDSYNKVPKEYGEKYRSDGGRSGRNEHYKSYNKSERKNAEERSKPEERKGKSYEKSRELAFRKEEKNRYSADDDKAKVEAKTSNESGESGAPTHGGKKNRNYSGGSSYGGKDKDSHSSRKGEHRSLKDSEDCLDDYKANKNILDDDFCDGKDNSKDPRTDRRIRNKDRPSLELYRPGMRRLSMQRGSPQKENRGSPSSSSSSSPVPQQCNKTKDNASEDCIILEGEIGKSSESQSTTSEEK